MKETYRSALLNLTENPKYTDLSRWRLRVKEGAQTWHYLTEEEVKTWPQTAADRYFLGLPSDAPELPKAKTPIEAAKKGFEFYKRLQTEDGHWAGEYGGPMFMVPGLIISHYITGTPVPDHERLEIIRYLLNRAHPDDGGWGLHIEGHSTVFITALTYVALRILGLGADHPALIKARGTLHKMGGATGAPAWGKFWLCAMGLYEWEGMNPVPPELWVLPNFLPIHPGKWWVHTRMVYLPMGYIYAKKLRPEPTDFIHDLRREIYVQPYESIDWNAQRNNIAKEDLYMPHTKLIDFIDEILVYYMKVPLSVNKLRQYALDATVDLIRMEDENTFFLDIGPVNKVLNWLVCYYHYGKESREFKEHVRRNADFMWLGPLWDTAFVAQACCEAGFADEAKNIPAMRKALEFLDDCQIKRNVPDIDKCYRHVSLGAWPFSTRDQGYTVSDCTAEGLKSVLQLQKLSQMPKLVNDDRLKQAVDVLLTMQNSDGGFASYERIRGPQWLEWLNPAEVFGDIMIEYSYPECTTAVLLGLSSFKKTFPDYRRAEIDEVSRKAVQYIRKKQRPDGSWFGSWAICFTYAALFSLDSLASVGDTYETCEHSRRGCDFLISKQQADGGWGELYKSCETGVYCQHPQSQVVQTAWACLALMSAKYPHKEPIKRGIELIMSRQQANGEWLQEGIEGVFNRNCMISYPNYKFSFTIWALGRYARLYGNE
ncbi:hypothetical protein BZG36_00978 [Bifiguratus adelaidae]|uniref:Terpene cyclase/mutase family member n=1 Tax=Bifiguratus adelaidae TaxID=1938954 RepID=A0A261Y6S3_9FUNG|nr:hypothetical protein BZG36_00978 [Bifiguratus adelaidae]